jgi:transposase-like protein
MEIITGVERRRRWRLEDKLRIVAEAERPGACVSKVAWRSSPVAAPRVKTSRSTRMMAATWGF